MTSTGKANHTSQIYSLESDIARRYPREIAVAQGQIEALKTDMEAAKPLLAQDKDHFSMEISGKVYKLRFTMHSSHIVLLFLLIHRLDFSQQETGFSAGVLQ